MTIFRVTVLFAVLLFVIKANSQIRGTIYDAETNLPLKGAHIIGDSIFAASDKNGAFLTSASNQLIVSHIGYISDTLALNGNRDTNIYLFPTYLRLDQITVKGNLHKYPLQMVPSSMALIPKSNLEPGSGISYMDKLNQVPGIFVHSGTLNTTRITVRGIGSRTPYSTNRIKAYYNNIPLTAGDGSTEIEDVDISGIDQIEILKGSKSALYGSGLGGVILLSNDISFQQELNGQVELSTASFDTHTAKANAKISSSKLSLSTGVSFINSEGWRQNSNYQRTNVLIDAAYKEDKTQVNFTILYIDTKAYIPSSLNKTMFENSPDSAAPNWLAVKGFEDYTKRLLGATWIQELTSQSTNTFTLFTSFNNAFESRPFNILDSDATKLGIRDILKMQFNRLTVQAGFELLFDSYNWLTYETNEGLQGNLLNSFSETRMPISVFANTQYQLKNKGIIELGISLNTLKYDLTDQEKDQEDLSGAYSYKPVFSPFVGVNYPFSNRVNFYSSVSHGFSAPSVEETLMPDGAINPELKPETGINTEAGLRLTGLDNKLFIDLCVYSMWIDNLLVTKRESEDVFYGANAGETWHKGFEFSSSFSINPQSNPFSATINLNYNYTQANFTNFVDDGESYTGNALPGVPEQNLWLSVKLNGFEGFYFIPQYQLVGDQYLNDANTESYSAYNTFNTTMGYKRKWFDFSFGVNNLLDSHYASMILVNAPSFGGRMPRYYYPGMPRNYWVKLRILI